MSGFSTARQKMVDGQVRTNDVTDRRILDAMLTVPREAFVPAGRQALAYLDLDLDVSEGATKRFLIKPALTGKLLQAAEIGEGDNVLVVGCATGYLAALTAKLARQVVATECDSALAAKAKDAFTALGLTNVTYKAAACTDGEPAAAPYDVIVLNGAAEVMPEALLGQLKEGGRLVGVSAESRPPRATIVTRTHGEFGHRALFDAAAPVLPGLERAAAFVF
ncbi:MULTISPECIES: protein-L-isoaspartate O-methyltransferase family protein [Bradyrhizobium]|uniref:Protein-L-isoaspartate O-methyltransferase n=1 Tax=Bradyrhizobium vignae TaxID=1549949 RepID=A0A2U3Q2A5_9BRAD|nr:protein-L-isoaspartate O-methyltransferase [Bradyrhizobium vignae]SPP95522.1 Protein-L-isoaspartate O-methyltransferase [Bradyrhizobium vignae]